MRWLLGSLRWAAICALAVGCAPSTSSISSKPEVPSAAIEIVPPARPLEAAIVIRQGSFARTRAKPGGMLAEFRSVLESARVFAATLDAAPTDGTDAWQLLLSAADYGEPNAYTFELQASIVRGKEPIAAYVSKQSARQSGGQLTIGPAELGQLAERAIRDVVRQIAQDTERLSRP